MIAAFLCWTKYSLDPGLIHRFGGALGAGHKFGSQTVNFGSSVVAKTTLQRNWRPPRSPRGEIILFDGYIDNRTELRSLFKSALKDDELYAAAYAAWGEAANLKVIGQYAAIIFHPDEKLVRLARSPLLAPPLHVWNDAQRFIVSSTPRSIFATGDVSQELDEQKIADSLFLNYREEERSWFKGVLRVPVGTRAEATPKITKFHKYYDLGSRPEIRLARDEDYVEAANSLLEQATRAALDGFSKPAVSLSGGYDSQAVAAYALRELKGKQLLGFTSVPEHKWDRRVARGRNGDESGHVKALAEMYPSLEALNVNAEGLYFDHRLMAMFMFCGGPPRAVSNLYWMHEVRSNAKSRGCDVILTGAMGNASFSFSGEGALSSWLVKGEWAELFREIRSSYRGPRSLLRVAWETTAPLLPNYAWRALQRFRRAPSEDPFNSWSPMNRAYADEMQVEERARNVGFDFSHQPFCSTRAWRCAVFSNAVKEFGSVAQALELIHGIPSRDPTSYRPLVEFCFSIPDDQYLRNGERRWLARRLLRGKVPGSVLNAETKGLQAADWHLRMGRQLDSLKAEVDRLAQDPAMARRINLVSLRKLLDEWPNKAPLGSASAVRLHYAVSRGIATARFIRYIEGQND